MSDYIYHIGDDYDCINKEYVILSTDKGQQITVALAASGVPFKGRYDNETIRTHFTILYAGDKAFFGILLSERFSPDKPLLPGGFHGNVLSSLDLISTAFKSRQQFFERIDSGYQLVNFTTNLLFP